MDRNEAGQTLVELSVSVFILALLVLLMMPSLNGYQVNAQVRDLGAQVVEQTRMAEQLALSQGQILAWHVCWDCAQNTVTFNEPNGSVISQIVLPPDLHVTGYCYRGQILPQGEVTVATPPCANPGATFEMICFDSNTPSNPYGWQITIVVATGQVIGQPIATPCH